MRIDIVFIILIVVLIAFGFGGRELINAWNTASGLQQEINKLNSEVEAIKQTKIALEAQLESLRKEIEALKTANTSLDDKLKASALLLDQTNQKLAETQAALDQANLAAETRSAQQSGTSLAGILGWIISGLLTLAAGLKAFAPGRFAGLIASSKMVASNSYVRLSPDETRQIINQRRKR